MQFLITTLEEYLSALNAAKARILSVQELGKAGKKDLKQYGYGKPLLIRYEVEDRISLAVLETMPANSYGHDHFSDRAQALLWQNECAGRLPGHVRSLDVGAFRKGGSIISLGDAEEFFLLSEFVEGLEYQHDLNRIRAEKNVLPKDRERAAALSKYLVEIHKTRKEAPHLYARRIRELVGHGECIMGLMDNYAPQDTIATPQVLKKIELRCVEWRWKLKGMHHRLCQVHGDFHPWNILFREGCNFTTLDRSRGEWGEAADDVSSMAINYLFEALVQEGRISGPFRELYDSFWKLYMENTGDNEIRQVLQPFFVFRALVLCNPTWYPELSADLRQRLVRFMENVLSLDEFHFEAAHEYFE